MATEKYIAPTYSAYCGVGITTGRRGGAEGSVLIGLVPSVRDTPAQRAGLKENDELLAVGTETGWHEVRSATQDQIQSWIRGTQGTPVALRLRKASDRQEEVVPLERALIIELPRWSDAPARYQFELEEKSYCSDLSQLPNLKRLGAVYSR